MYIVMSASAKMPSTCWGRYRRVAVAQLTQQYTAMNWRPAMISARARGVLRIARDFGPQHTGTSPRCAYNQALAQAGELAHRLNNARDVATAEQILGAGGSA